MSNLQVTRLYNDAGQDILINTNLLKADEIIYCPKAGKEVGRIRIFKTEDALVIHTRDIRRAAKKVYLVQQFPLTVTAETLFDAIGYEQVMKKAAAKVGITLETTITK